MMVMGKIQSNPLIQLCQVGECKIQCLKKKKTSEIQIKFAGEYNQRTKMQPCESTNYT